MPTRCGCGRAWIASEILPQPRDGAAPASERSTLGAPCAVCWDGLARHTTCRAQLVPVTTTTHLSTHLHHFLQNQLQMTLKITMTKRVTMHGHGWKVQYSDHLVWGILLARFLN